MTLPGTLTVATSRYSASQKVVESGLAPVRTTSGAPRFRLGYELAGDVGMLAPTACARSRTGPSSRRPTALASTASASTQSAPPSSPLGPEHTHALRGVPGSWRVFAASSPEG